MTARQRFVLVLAVVAEAVGVAFMAICARYSYAHVHADPGQMQFEAGLGALVSGLYGSGSVLVAVFLFWNVWPALAPQRVLGRRLPLAIAGIVLVGVNACYL